jgi:PPM family protein phosphatase
LNIQWGSHTSQGKVRTSNEDSFIANPDSKLLLVADGMGGHAAGEIASQIAASTIDDWVTSHRDAGENAGEMLRKGAQEANTRVFEAQRQDSSLAGMGSTLTAMVFRDDRYYVAHVGDSRAYRLRADGLEQLTRDHSLVWHLYENGVLEKADLSKHPQKNLITRSIGSHPQVDVDLEEGEALAGDVYLLCSDGLTDGVPEEKLRQMLSDEDMPPQKIAEDLVDAANAAGGPDNITVVVIRLLADSVPGRSASKSQPR